MYTEPDKFESTACT